VRLPGALVAVLAVAVLAAQADARGSHVTLTVARAGTGDGRVASSPPYIDCGSVCSALIPSVSEPGGGPIVLTATPGGGSAFTGWAGACSGSAPTCTVSPDEATSVTAIFDRAGSQSLRRSRSDARGAAA
jgi:Divergent InlB B-repeat domain